MSHSKMAQRKKITFYNLLNFTHGIYLGFSDENLPPSITSVGLNDIFNFQVGEKKNQEKSAWVFLLAFKYSTKSCCMQAND